MAGAMRLSGRCYPEASAKAPWSLSHLTSFPAGPERTTPRSAPCSAPGRSRSLSSRLISSRRQPSAGGSVTMCPGCFCPVRLPHSFVSRVELCPSRLHCSTDHQPGTRRHGSSRACASVCVQSHLQILGV
jgi:hypothetical protein